ncbi:MBL fold metallo-hydrolase [Marinomonas aquiplantarum]|uniref:L-ascorbate metabolism protein UlaG (Beta-lactamase superfamily) n=1 Tax=Marinomonas aquiplantarum TaxID=491951 RepID=A0A366CUB6_9GAMM|nr:MBL fold metallo-hydrolase [Marinomonas aquiplantarum]RBO79903.1 L-ascorbate metabolism protein UlaG (beta-lactamase superfamily) [Marinomonas aquiplantarum]
MLVIKLFVALISALVLTVYLVNLNIKAKVPPIKEVASAPYKDAKFHNTEPRHPVSFTDMAALWIRFFTEKKVDTTPDIQIPVHALSRTDLEALSDDTLHIVKLGHSSILLKNYGEYWLIDPVFSDRASPFQFVGPKRFHQPPIRLEDLPTIDKVLISHNHYDHLDKASVKVLLDKTKQFLVPKGVDGDLINWGVKANNIVTFDWWQELRTKQGLVAFTPTQHFSGRGIGDGNRTLWGAWVIKTPQDSLFFSGDSGYFSGFKETGEKYGPFDLTMVETGAYDQDWSDIHMLPEESVQAHIDLQGKVMMPIHNGTFDLAFHSWHDPFDRVVTESMRRDVTLSTPEFGRIFSINNLPALSSWWKPAD